jgi:SAM-dependent methyltransferase
MASSFSAQIPGIIHLISKLQPKKVLDIGKGFGKYGFLIHEYIGIDNSKRVNPELTMAQQSNVVIDCVEVDCDLFLPHILQLYNKIYEGDILEIYQQLPQYDLVLMIDIIEHIPKEGAIRLLKYFLSNNTPIIIATPIEFFEQHLYESEFENHVSHWQVSDFRKIACVDHQYFESGAVYLLSNNKMNYRGFGNSAIKKLRRIARVFRNELKV